MEVNAKAYGCGHGWFSFESRCHGAPPPVAEETREGISYELLLILG